MAEIRRRALVGRDEQSRLLREVVAGSGGTPAEAVLLCGAPGAGKTALLDVVAGEAAARGVLVVRATASADVLDLVGVADAVLGAVARGTAEADLVGRVDALRRARDRTRHDPRAGLALVAALVAVLARVAASRPSAVLLDNVERIAPRQFPLFGTLLRGMRTAGIPLVLACRTTRRNPEPPAELALPADRVVELPGLDRAAVRELISAALEVAAEEDLVDAVRAALGPRAGVPGDVLALLGALDPRDSLVVVDGHACLPATELPAGLPLEREGTSAECDRVVEVAALVAGLTATTRLLVDELLSLAPALDRPVDDLGTALDLLVEDGVLSVGPDDRVTCAVPAVARSLRAGPDRWDLPALHASIAAGAVRRGGLATACGDPAVRGHALAAGGALPAEVATPLLLAAVERAEEDPGQAIRAAVALLDALPPEDRRVPGLLSTAMRLMMRRGHVRGLVDLGNRVMLRRDRLPARAVRKAGLVWAFAVVQARWTGADAWVDPAAETVAAGEPEAAGMMAMGARAFPALAGPGPAGGRTEAGAWAAVGPVPGSAEANVLVAGLGDRDGFETALAELRRAGGGPADPEQVRDALAFEDWGAAYAILLGESRTHPVDRRPRCGYRDLVDDYLAGEWDAALSKARRIEARATAAHRAPQHDLACAVAAEVCRARGDLPRAVAWLDRIPADAALGPVLAWVRCGVRHDLGRTAEAAERGWADYRALRAAGHLVGLERLLLRLGRQGGAGRDAVPAELADLHDRVRSRGTEVGVLVARAMAGGDVRSALAAHALVAARPDRALLFTIDLLLVRLADDPRAWLAEARDLADRFASRQARRLLTQVAKARGVAPPRRRAEREAFSALEVQVLDLVSAGATNRQIATSLGRSEKSVENYLARLFERSGCRSRLELAMCWVDGSLAAQAGREPDQAGRKPDQAGRKSGKAARRTGQAGRKSGQAGSVPAP
ncbi:AAA family ATPase [Saccharothrix sp. Mg75]|uniref:helix-turn-helix transcriptional regulator n=1 Tax=Saccharothrix sp. Mg75 TaxID=3445357 RepID=UPI003EE99DFC